ncbi:MAG: flippase-like domain-containing protein [Candidatus Sumerlaea chitinivorans]|nr:flippase-like domain-containing protein [Candidatus Sumerlaea chitinivorans]
MKPTRQKVRSYLPTVIRLLVSAALLWGVFHIADFKKSVGKALSVPWLFALGGFCVFALGELLTILKWQYLLWKAGRKVPFLLLAKAVLVGNFYSMFLPTSVGGDVARVLMVGQASGGLSMSAATVFMQRNTGMGALLLIANVASWLPPLKIALFPSGLDVLNYVGVWFGLIAIVYLAINWVLISERIYTAVWKHLGPDGQAPVTRWQRVGTPLRTLHHAVRLCKGAWVGALALSVCTQLLDCTMAYLVGCGLGLGLSFTQFCVYVPAVTLAALLPITFNGVGLRESVYLVLMERSGIAKDQAVGLSLVHFAFMLILALAGGIWHVLAPLNATSTPNAEKPTQADSACSDSPDR